MIGGKGEDSRGKQSLARKLTEAESILVHLSNWFVYSSSID
ncbi:hypothetical protein ABEY62_01510 [Priestia megaterium]|nr:hypothetical protein [Priestia megaterium]